MRCVSKSAGRLVIGRISDLERFAGGARHGFLASDQLLDHFGSRRRAFFFLDGRQGDELLVRTRSRVTQRADALGNRVQRIPQLGVLAL